MGEKKRESSVFLLVGFISFFAAGLAPAEVKLLEDKNYCLSLTPYLRTDVVSLKNTVDLDSHNRDDSTTYFGYDYSLGWDLKLKDDGPEAYLKLERNGPYDYDAPLFIHNTLRTSVGKVDNYDDKYLLPQIEEFWLDIPLQKLPLRLKSGLFAYQVGHGFSLNGAYENYGINLYGGDENSLSKWNVYYCYPDISSKNHLGPRIKQEQVQGINYEHSKVHFFATDVSFSLGEESVLQPYLGVLFDRTNEKRLSYFSTPTHKDTLGTFGLSSDLTLGKLSLGIEGAKNFGEAKSSDSAFKDVKHTGYLFYASAAYDFTRLKPHSRFILASGNKVTTEMTDNGDTLLTSGKNRAFSVYSPFNANIADALSHNVETLPLVAMAGGWGLNYGINRPTTFADGGLFDNLILQGLGFDYQLNDKLSFTIDTWFLRAMERGVGTFAGVSKKLSADLGQEVDLFCAYSLNDKVSLNLSTGYFFPGKYYKEERDDTTGSLFTPFIRGDGNANGAYQIELNMEVKF